MRIFFENVSTIAFLLYRYNFRSPATAWELKYRMNWFYFRCDSRCNSCIIFIWKSNINQFNIFPKVCYAFKAKIFDKYQLHVKNYILSQNFWPYFLTWKDLGDWTLPNSDPEFRGWNFHLRWKNFWNNNISTFSPQQASN